MPSPLENLATLQAANRIGASGYAGASQADQAAFDQAFPTSQSAQSMTLQQARDAADKAAQGQTMDLGSTTLRGGASDRDSDGTTAEQVVGGGTQIPVAKPFAPLNALAGKYLRGYFNASPNKETQP